MKKTGAAIIGCGNIFPIHADAVSEGMDQQLQMVIDIDERKAEAAAKKYDCHYDTDYLNLLQNRDIEVVHLCTPHYLHGSMANSLMQAGKHVLTEKPMGMSLQQCRGMNAVARETQCYLGVCFQNRYHDTSMKMKTLIQSGEMGRILGARAFVTWFREESYYNCSAWRGTWDKEGGSLLMNQAIHTLDLLQWLLGDVADVRGTTSTHFLSEIIETEDTAEALLTFQSGARALFYASNAYTSNAPVYLEVLCEHGSMVLNGDLTVKWEDGRTETYRDDPPSGYKSYWGTGHRKLIHDFYHCVNNQLPFPVNGNEGSKVIGIIERIYGANVHTG